MSRYIDLAFVFISVFVGCILGFSVIIGIVWLWIIGLMSVTNELHFALYVIATIAIVPAAAITHTIMEDNH